MKEGYDSTSRSWKWDKGSSIKLTLSLSIIAKAIRLDDDTLDLA